MAQVTAIQVFAMVERMILSSRGLEFWVPTLVGFTGAGFLIINSIFLAQRI